ncbi:NXPE family member 2-like [Spea bombifrons]|uniref:NXPE family member 2-like n=1 Tax=Spea bombifrons TaxID=233779 RepID=UPI002349C192|nr:NXPE family member 2-like [Spea bombifrons]
MLESSRMRVPLKLAVPAALALALLLILNQTKVQIPKITYLFQTCDHDKAQWASFNEMYAYDPVTMDENIEEIFNRVSQRIPKVALESIEKATSAENSNVTIINPKDKYCIGDHLLVKVQAYDYLGDMKTYGGDYLRARIYSPASNSSASGKITDFNNGTYTINFGLFWEGEVYISVLLMHPSEAVSALWRARNQGLQNIKYTGNFTSATEYVNRECNFELDTEEDICSYEDRRDNEAFYCIKPPNFPCEALTHMNSVNRNHSYLTEAEQRLLNRSNIGVDISKRLKPVNVFSCGKKLSVPTEKCNLGAYYSIPSGYFSHNRWNPIYCQMTMFTENEKLKNFLKGKKLFLIGDSTVRQYIRHFAEVLKIVDYFNHTEDEMQTWQKTLLGINLEKFIYIQWKKHTFPFVTQSFYSIKEDTYMARQIDQIGGGENTIIVLTMGQHFRPFPLRIFIKSAINARRAIERLFIRSPRTKVIIKEENVRDMDINMERFSDFHGHINYLVLREIFKGLNIGFVDALDMTIAYASYVIHPPVEVLENIISMSFTHAL